MPLTDPALAARNCLPKAAAAAVVVLGLAVVIGSGVSIAAIERLYVRVNCLSSPERVTVLNDRRKAITVTSVGSLYQPFSSEPYPVRRRLQPGERVTYTFGARGGPNRLTGRYIFANDSAREGVRVGTSLGSVRRLCGQSDAFPTPPGEPTPSPAKTPNPPPTPTPKPTKVPIS